MKPSLPTIAIILSVIAIVISLIQPTYNFLTSMNKTESGIPSFSISGTTDFYVFYTFTRITLSNWGNATAHNVRANLIFTGPALPNWEATESLSEINKDETVMIEIPIGYYQLNSTVPKGEWFSNVTSYEAYVHITCQELEQTTTFHFQHFIT